MCHKGPFVNVYTVILAAALLAAPTMAIAQGHGGGHASGGGFGLAGIGRPDGVDEKDALKDFHRALAVQASSQQVAEYQTLLKSMEAARNALGTLQPGKSNAADLTARGAALDQAIESARSSTKRFVDGFSEPQKSGLKEIIKRLTKADSDLEQEEKRLDLTLADAKAAGTELSAHTESLDKALGELQDEQLALGREMSIVMANGQDMAFTLPQVKSPVTIGNRTVSVTASGVLSQIAAENGERTFRLNLIADLSEMQLNITEFLRARLDRSDPCGQRVDIRQASLRPATPGGLLVVTLHFERWTCNRAYGQTTSNELGGGDGTVELKLTPAVGDSNGLKVSAEFGRIDASGMLTDELRSGSLGEDLREKASQVLLYGMRSGTDFKTALPLAIQNLTTVQSARFLDDGVGDLSIALEGQVQLSNEQANQMATQLNQALSAQAPPPGTVPQLTTRPQ
jgi:hypothetical protein